MRFRVCFVVTSCSTRKRETFDTHDPLLCKIIFIIYHVSTVFSQAWLDFDYFSVFVFCIFMWRWNKLYHWSLCYTFFFVFVVVVCICICVYLCLRFNFLFCLMFHFIAHEARKSVACGGHFGHHLELRSLPTGTPVVLTGFRKHATPGSKTLKISRGSFNSRLGPISSRLLKPANESRFFIKLECKSFSLIVYVGINRPHTARVT